MKTEAEIRRQLNGLIIARDTQVVQGDFTAMARVDAGIRTMKWILGEM